MFTGIVEEVGKVLGIDHQDNFARFHIGAKEVLQDLKLGSSICVNGVCLTAASLNDDGFIVDVSPETLRVTNLGSLGEGEGVNLERALRVGDRMDGHWVTGHVEGVGVLRKRQLEGEGQVLFFETPEELMRFCVNKGSIAVDGISLTINQIEPKGFYVTLIPHTLKVTTLGEKKLGSLVNLETDLIGKYIERLCLPSDS